MPILFESVDRVMLRHTVATVKTTLHYFKYFKYRIYVVVGEEGSLTGTYLQD